MASTVLGVVIRQLHSRLAHQAPDAKLLHDFAGRRDESAFAALVERHGPMVLGVCRRMLADAHDAEDAFQATFLTLAHRARSIRRPASIAAWLHGVARRISLRARGPHANISLRPGGRQRFSEAVDSAGDPLAALSAREMCTLLDEELSRLKERHRAPLVLCYLEGKTGDEAARELGWSLSTFKRRLGRGRELLRLRLERRGLTLSAVLGTALAGHDASALPMPLVIPTIQAAVRVATSGILAGVISARVVALSEGALQAMNAHQLKAAALGLLVLVIGGLSVGLLALPAPSDQEEKPAVQRKEQPPGGQAAKPRVDAHGDPLPEGAIARLGTVRFRHGSFVEQVVLSEDGKRLISQSRWEGVRVWDAATGKELRRFPETVGPVLNRYAAALSPDGRLVAMVERLGEFGTTVILRDIMTGQAIGEAGPISNPAGVQFSPDGKLLAVADCGNRNEPTVGIWEAGVGRLLHALKGHKEPVRSLVFTSDGKTLITGGGFEGSEGVKGLGDGRIIVWDVGSGKQGRELNAGPGAVHKLAVSADGRRLASLNMIFVQTGPRSAAGYHENRIRIWDLEGGKELRQLIVDSKDNQFGRPQGFYALLFTPKGRELLTSGPDRLLRVWDVDSGRQSRQLAGPPLPLSFSADGKTLAGAAASAIQMFDWATARETDASRRLVVWGAQLADNRTALTLGADGSIVIWDIPAARERARLAGHPDGIMAVVPARDGRTLFSVGADQLVRVWDVVSGKELRKWPAEVNQPPLPVTLLLSPDEKNLALWIDNQVRVFDTNTGHERGKFKHSKKVVTLAFTPEATLTVCTGEHAVHVWDLKSGRKAETFDLPVAQVTRTVQEPLEERRTHDYMALVSPDGKLLAYSCFDFALVDLATWRVLKGSLQRLPGGLRSFSPDGRVLACSGHWPDGSIILIEVATGQERRRIKGHQGPVNSLVFSQDGRLLLSVAQDATALIWDLIGADEEPAVPLSPEDLQKCWMDLAEADAGEAYQAMLKLARAADQAVPFLANRLHALPHIDEKQVARLIIDLGSDQFNLRETATGELDRLGEKAVMPARKALRGNPSPEVRRRLEELLERYEYPAMVTSPERLRALRALEVLELARTPAARDALARLARGAKGGWLTEQAKVGLERWTISPTAP